MMSPPIVTRRTTTYHNWRTPLGRFFGLPGTIGKDVQRRFVIHQQELRAFGNGYRRLEKTTSTHMYGWHAIGIGRPCGQRFLRDGPNEDRPDDHSYNQAQGYWYPARGLPARLSVVLHRCSKTTSKRQKRQGYGKHNPHKVTKPSVWVRLWMGQAFNDIRLDEGQVEVISS